MAKGQAEHLMPMLLDFCKTQGVALQDVDAVAVCTGPGNFTGIRIAVSAARGLALGLDKPAIGVTAFEAQVHGLPRPVTACISAPRDTAYTQVFSTDSMTDPVQSPRPDDGIAMLAPDVMIANVVQIAALRLGDDIPAPAPLYVRAADAAPPRDPAPVILP